MKTILLAIKLWSFKRFFKKYKGQNPNADQEKMFKLAERGLTQPSYGRASGVSTFIVLYAHYKQTKGLKALVIGSRYLRALAQDLLAEKRKFPIIAHNSDYAVSETYDILVIDQADSLSLKFREKVLAPLVKSGKVVVEIDTN